MRKSLLFVYDKMQGSKNSVLAVRKPQELNLLSGEYFKSFKGWYFKIPIRLQQPSNLTM